MTLSMLSCSNPPRVFTIKALIPMKKNLNVRSSLCLNHMVKVSLQFISQIKVETENALFRYSGFFPEP